MYPTANALTLAWIDQAPMPRVMNWGLPRKDGKGVIFNVRAETALSRPFFRSALRANPLAVPVSGFYEWQTENKKKLKIRFTDPASPLFYLAGFWQTFSDSADPLHFTVLTTEANPSVRPFHHRMPVLLQSGQVPDWLSGQATAQILAASPMPVSATICGPLPQPLLSGRPA